MVNKIDILNLSEQILEKVIKHRRHLHKHPELSFKENKTSKYIKSVLDSLNIKYLDSISGNTIIGIIEGKEKGKTIGIRADMDALPINEETGLEYSSSNQGVMHACGHDFHMSALLGTAEIISKIRDKINGTYILIFQPAEEKLPGGAKLLLETGFLKKYKPDFIIAQHVHPELPSGKIGFKSGIYMASADEIYITVKGKGGHAAMPHRINDTVLAASQIVVSLQQVVSRLAAAKTPSVLSLGKFIANGATNVIPSVVEIEGTFRTYDEKWRFEAHDKIKEIVEKVASAYGCEGSAKIIVGYPYLENNEDLTKETKKIVSELLGEEEVMDLEIEPIAEDFAYFSQQYPSTMFRLGVKPKNKEIFSLHHSKFNPDENALKNSLSALTWISLTLANK